MERTTDEEKNHETSLDFKYVWHCLVMLQFYFNFLIDGFRNLNLDINSMFVKKVLGYYTAKKRFIGAL